MLSGSEVLEKFVYDEHKKIFFDLNKNPIKFNFNLELESTIKYFNKYKEKLLLETLAHMTLNSLQAMSGIFIHGDQILKVWKPESPPTLTYKIIDYNYGSRIYIEDEGIGINPYVVLNHIGWKRKLKRKVVKKIRKKNGNDPKKIIDYIFKYGVTTKQTGGWGLTKSQSLMKRINGEIRIHGTTYNDLGDLVTLKNHHGKKTGATFSIDIRYPRYMKY